MNRLISLGRHTFIGVALLTVLAPAAQADIKIFSAGGCLVTAGVPGEVKSNALGIVQNTSFVTDGSIACFLVRDHPTAKPAKIEVSVVDNSSVTVGTKDISCRAILVDRFGRSTASGGPVSTSGTNANGTILNLPVPGAAVQNGTIAVQCTIPRRAVGNPSSSVASIKLTEPNPAP